VKRDHARDEQAPPSRGFPAVETNRGSRRRNPSERRGVNREPGQKLYGGMDHPWINPQASAVAYCVYIPVKPSTMHWQYDAPTDHVTADVYVVCPDLNPCKAEQGANQVLSCLGDPTNIEILVDTASLDDGVDVGLALANASTDLYLLLPDSSRVHLHTGL